MSSTKVTDDPRDASLEVRFSVPNTWHEDTTDLSATGMMFSGLIMVTRNRYLAWPAVALSLSGWINKRPMRSKDGGGASLSSVSLCLMALIASYLPMFMITKTPAAFNAVPSS